MSSPQLPATYKGVLFSSASEPATVADIPTPPVEPGSVLVRPLYSWIPSYADQLYTNGNPRQYPIPFPVVGGAGSIGRVAAVGPDAAGLRVGDLVTTEPFIRSRDDPDAAYILAMGMSSEAWQRDDYWLHGTWAELVRMPLENTHRFDEAKLRQRGVALPDLGFFGQLAIPYGGLRDVDVRAGETVLIAPATGNFGGAAVHVALAMGARVIAMGRNAAILAELRALAPGRVETVVLSGSEETDSAALASLGPIDVFYDMTPGQVKPSSAPHVRAGILSVRPGGRVSLSGGLTEIERFPYTAMLLRNLTVRGTMMYTAAQARELIKMIETGVLRLGPGSGLTVKKVFPLEEWNEAIETAAKEAGAGRVVLFAPNQESS